MLRIEKGELNELGATTFEPISGSFHYTALRIRSGVAEVMHCGVLQIRIFRGAGSRAIYFSFVVVELA